MSKLDQQLYEAFLNHLQLEVEAFYEYWSHATKFKQVESSYPGFAHYFETERDEEFEHAQQIINFLTKRGRDAVLPALKAHATVGGSPYEVLKLASYKEQDVLNSLSKLHDLSSKDVDASCFVGGMIVCQQKSMAKLYRKMNELTEFTKEGNLQLGLRMYDQKLLNKKHKNKK